MVRCTDKLLLAPRYLTKQRSCTAYVALLSPRGLFFVFSLVPRLSLFTTHSSPLYLRMYGVF
jgi:hypothetical protein